MRLGHEMRFLFLAGRAALQPTAADRARVFAALNARMGVTRDLLALQPTRPHQRRTRPMRAV
jgi:hypothetical protein